MVNGCPGRVLAIDHGDARVGLAISDELRWTVRPLETLANRGRGRLCETLVERIRDLEVALVVVGDPLHADDGVGARARVVRAFACELAALLERSWSEGGAEGGAPPIVLWDESGSTEEACAELRRSGSSPRRMRRKGGIDRVAAAVILRDWLRSGAPESPAVAPRTPARAGAGRGGAGGADR